MSIIKFESKAVAKLIEVVSEGIGTLYKPRAIRKEADAVAYKNETLAKAEAKKILIEGEAQIELIERAKKRLVNQELNRQINIEEIAERSIKYLDENVSEEPVDNDWRTKFFAKAQDVSEEDMREIWAKILATEVSRPGTINFRTLEVVSNISRKEAETFQIACSLASSKSYIWKLKGQNSLDEFGLSYSDLMIIRDAGLVHDNDNLIKIIKVVPQLNVFVQIIGNDFYQIKVTHKREQKEYRFNQIAFTVAGKELCQLINANLNEKYLMKIIEERQNDGYELIKIETKTPHKKL
ncbi:MAG: DUF2806 domain-containing protein [Candidatus Paceibacterota bacterium]|jgi:hypothetical protein